MPIILQGTPPFELPFAQSATAEAADTNVQLTFRVLDEPTLQLVHVRVRMTIATARGLASHIAPASMVAEVRARQNP